MVLDVETTVKNKGNVRTAGNFLVTIQLKVGDEETRVFTKETFSQCRPILDSASVIVGTNLKFDLAWIKRELDWEATTVWDLQIAEFLFSNQMWKYPDLDGMCEKYNIEKKLDIVKTEYWEKGIDTPDIPLDILSEYGKRDCDVTYKVFLQQVQQFQNERQGMFKLFRVHCNDLLVLLDMENNGIVYDTKSSIARAEELEEEMKKVEGSMYVYTKGIPINFDSPEQVSKLLYGGTITVTTKVPCGVFKTGQKVGQVKYKNLDTDYTLPRLIEPLKNTGKAKEGIFSTDESTLLSLKANKAGKYLISQLLRRSKLEKEVSTYLKGFPKLIDKYEWKPDMLYSTLNQCLVVTGRLSSAKPNQQNFSKEVKRFCISRFS